MGDYHAKFEENWWYRFQIKRGQQTDGHSFIIIGKLLINKLLKTKYFFGEREFLVFPHCEAGDKKN